MSIDKFQPHHAVVKTVGIPAPGDAKLLWGSLSGQFHRDLAPLGHVEPRMDARSGIINGNDLRAVKKNAPCGILAAQNHRNLNRKPSMLPSFAHELGRACSPPGCGVKDEDRLFERSQPRKMDSRRRPAEENPDDS